MKKKEKAELVKWDKEYIWHPFTQMKDWLKEDMIIIDEGKGVYLKDINGRKYIDGVSSIWVNIHGHRNPHLNKAIKKQLGKISHSTFLGLSHPQAIILAKKLVEITPSNINKVFFSDNGSTAMEIAVKMAFQYWQQIKNRRYKNKKYFVSLTEGYHGDTVGSVSIGGIDLFHKMYKPLLFKTYKVPSPYCYRCRYLENCEWQCIQKIDNLFRANADKIAGFIIEPLMQGAGGMIIQPEGYLRKVYDLCKKYNILFIADEVATGFGRTGTMFACEHDKIRPDFMAVSKGISGGYLPVAATLTHDKIFNAFVDSYESKKTFFHGHSYTANPLGCSVCNANIELFYKNRVLDKLQKKIKYLNRRLDRFYELEHVGDVRQCGFMVGIELVKDKKTKEAYEWREKMGVRVIKEAVKHGVIIRPLGNVIVLMPPLSISYKDLSKLVDIVYDCIKKITEI